MVSVKTSLSQFKLPTDKLWVYSGLVHSLAKHSRVTFTKEVQR